MLKNNDTELHYNCKFDDNKQMICNEQQNEEL